MSIYTLKIFRPTCYMLIGVPGSGKTTWVLKNYPDLAYASTDKYIDQFAAEAGKTYNEVFEASIKIATSRMIDDVADFITDMDDFVWDQTNISKKSRAGKITRLRQDYYQVVGIVFETPKNLKERLATRPGKNIPPHVMESMIENFEMPTIAEGFSKIIIAENE